MGDSDEWTKYVNDPRTICKYTSKCYQKNPEHHKRFKHPPHKIGKAINRAKGRLSPYTRPSPRRSPARQEKCESPSCNNEDAVAKSDDVASDSKPEQLDEQEPDDQTVIEFPKKITFYDKSTDNSLLKELFLVEMPDDFFKFFECISECGKSFEDTLSSVNLMAIGPFELLMGKLPKLDNKELYLVHWRFFYDPPEFQAILKNKKKDSQYHIGYFRDDPKEAPVFVASNDSEKNYHITPMAYNLFGAVYKYLQNEKKHSPFTSMACQKVMDKLKSYAEKNNISLEEFDMKKRSANVVTKSFHGAGIVVPYDKKTQIGYRRLVETDATLKKMFTKLEEAISKTEKMGLLSELQPVITNINIALDESDFGTGIEGGIALFCSGLQELAQPAMSSLVSAYSVLNRNSFGDIIKAHIKYRRKGANVSLLHMSASK
ncbi:histone PARylation factor 1 [Spodoptera litura]|uniref:Histone PARylation factor 1 n=1 Tax=Spodoptera litura TaxID=69820 RepID=A0A9J7EDQ0_SPOLT|nr:histone PARylation factor 1 [Spodoptera litura]